MKMTTKTSNRNFLTRTNTRKKYTYDGEHRVGQKSTATLVPKTEQEEKGKFTGFLQEVEKILD